jgi:catechol 2,3-dioxygenase-like lactoylglutathione lyase family enzyme
MPAANYNITTLNYVTLYFHDFDAAVAFYTAVFGPPDSIHEETIIGWRLGDTWLTFFPAKEGTHPGSNPRNTEFAIQVATPEEVDRLHAALMTAGAKDIRTPEYTRMYVPMRFCCVEDPFGVRIDVLCPST